MRCAISQPTFLPWLGWFDIASQVDLVVILDTVPFAKRSWQQRNRIRTADGLHMVTVPVYSSGKFLQNISDVKVADPGFGESFLRTIQGTYGRAPHFSDVFADLKSTLENSLAGGSLLSLNFGLTSFLARWLRVNTPFVMAASVPAKGKRGDYLAEICAAVGANDYYSTAGASEYLKKDLPAFEARNIQIFIHDYVHPTYRQLHEPFMSHASALDLVMMTGPESSAILKSSPGKWVPI